MFKKLHFKSWLLMLCMLLGVGNAWATDVLSWSRSGTTNTYTTGYEFGATAAAKSGYYQDGSGTSGIKLYSKSSPICSATPASVTFTASVGGGTGNKDLSSSVYVCYVDANGSAIDGTETEVTSHITTNTGDTYEIPMPTSSATGAYGVYIYHTKESGYNVRYFSFSLSYETSGGGDPGDTRTATTVTIDDSGITNTNVFEGTAAGSFSATVMAGESAVSGASVTWESETPSVATIDAASGVVTLVAAGSTKITATYAGDTSYKNSSATYTLTVTNDDPNGPGTENNPYTVAQARAAIDAGTGVTGVYATGIVSEIVTPFDSGYGNITYNISADGSTTADQLQAYRGKSYNGDWFTSADDIQVGDVVVVYGNLTKYGSTYEFATNNQLVSLQRVQLLDNEITVTGGTEKSIDTNTEYELTLAATATSGEAVIFTVDATSTTLTEGVDFEFVNGNTVGIIQAKAGTIVIKANSAATSEYKAADEVTITITVIGAKQNPTITVADASVAYGSTFTVDDSVIEGGEITVTSSNEAVATVSGLVITPAAVGTTTITVATAEDATYKAGSETFILTVTAPEGKEDAPSATGGFVKVTSTDDITDGEYLIVCEGGSVAFDGSLGNPDETGNLDAVGNTIDVTIDNGVIESNATTDAATFIIDTTNGTLQSKSGYYIGGAASYGNGMRQTAVEEEAYVNTFEIDDDENAVITFSYPTNAVTLRYNSASNQLRFRYYKSGQQAIQLYKKVAGSSAVEEVTLNTSGYATYCSENPLDFNDTSDDTYTAWQLTGIDGTTITFMQITGAIKGGQGILLKKGANNTDADPATIEIPMTDSNEELSSNLLEGTLAPTYKEAGSCYGLSGNTFVKAANAGVVKAGKAFFDASCVSADVKAFTFVFDSADGIQTIEKVSAEEAARIFDLSGRRLSRTQKGVNIVNGKKILVK